MKIKEALIKASQDIGVKEARILLASFLKRDNLYLITHEDEDVADLTDYFTQVQKHNDGVPVEYLTNRVSFYSKEFFIDRGALIPRPETEILIQKTIDVAKNLEDPTIVEIGVGSGVISIILALELKRNIVATDISADAISLAKKNATNFEVIEKITFIETSLLDNIEQNFDIIVSNPPYIAKSATLDHNLSYEPDSALFGGEAGDEILKDIIDLAIKKDVKYLCCEMGYDQKNSLNLYMKDRGIEAKFYRDLAGFDRGFVARIGNG